MENILGETGTVKGVAATAIGRSGFIPWDNRKGCFHESFTPVGSHLPQQFQGRVIVAAN